MRLRGRGRAAVVSGRAGRTVALERSTTLTGATSARTHRYTAIRTTHTATTTLLVVVCTTSSVVVKTSYDTIRYEMLF